jgi:C_GCAxxG_C_C family probable redox protein
MTHKEKAMKIFDEISNCAQAVLGAYADDHGLTADQAMKVAACFSGGMRKGEVCGAVSGALMVIGLKYGDGLDYKATAYPKAAEFMDRFKEKNGSCVCRDILGCDISSEEGRLYARENGLFKDICPRMVGSAVDIMEEMEIR